jgi:hypothetical protein
MGYVKPYRSVPGFFLGQVFRIDAALPRQDYSEPTTGCVSNWAVLAPPANGFVNQQDPLLLAITPVAEMLRRFDAASKEATHSSAVIFLSPETFADWLKEDGDSSLPTALLTISHHDRDKLFFAPGSPNVFAAGISRQFGTPSAALLIGCGTAAVGATEIARRLNALGASTIVATSTEVKGDLAGAFLARLLQLLDEHRNDSGYGLGRARFEASRMLFDSYGAEALSFILIGNGRLRLCPPIALPTALQSVGGQRK